MTLEWVTITVLVLVLAAWYLTYTAARLHRLHTRIEGTYAALTTRFVRRAEAVIELANSGALDTATALLLVDAAAASLERAQGTLEDGLGPHTDRERIESALTAQLREALPGGRIPGAEDASWEQAVGTASVQRVAEAHEAMAMARRVHNEAVADTVRVRRKLVVRAAHLPGRTPMPQPVRLDDAWPDPRG